MAVGGPFRTQQGDLDIVYVWQVLVNAHFQEYLYELAKAIRELAPESSDPHLEALEVRINYIFKRDMLRPQNQSRNRALDATNGQRQTL